MFSPYYPPHLGGLENYAQELAKHLGKMNTYSVTIITSDIPQKKQYPEYDSHTDIIRLPSFEPVSNFPVPKIWHPLFWHQLRQARYGLLVTSYKRPIFISHTRFFLSSLMAGILAKTYRIPWIHIEHGSAHVTVSNKFTSFFAYIYDQAIGKWVLRHSDQNIAISQAVAKFINKFDNRPVEVIYRGIELENISLIKPADTPSNKIIIVTAARLFKWKGIDIAMQAVTQLPPETQKNILYLIIGSGEDQQRLKQFEKDNIKLIGALSHHETLSYLQRADIYLHPSLPGGGLATSLLEAMACSCAIAATPNEGAYDVIAQNVNGLLINEPTPTSIAQTLEILVNDNELRRRLSLQAQKTAREICDWDKSVQKITRLMSDISKL